jgi:hypothetical protein
MRERGGAMDAEAALPLLRAPQPVPASFSSKVV